MSPDTRTQLDATFSNAYERLNEGQRQAVDTIEGPVMVIAGPGTGKTQILTLRIANILRQTDTRPEQILALTFTEAAARNMRERLTSFIGPAAYEVAIHTFHGFAERLIRGYPDAYPQIVGAQVVGDLEQYQIISDILRDPQYRVLRPSGAPELYVKDCLSAIQALKREYLAPDDFAKHLATQAAALEVMPQYHERGAHKGKERSEYRTAVRQLAKHQELLSVYRSYQSVLRERQRFDYEDMILETVAALETSEDMLRDVQERYQYVLADEHQDVNQSQNQILERIVDFHARPNIFVVGDEKQAIYRFQGASLDNFLYFGERFSDVTVIQLTDNYRSGPAVLELAQAVIATDDPTVRELRVPLRAATETTATIAWHTFPHTTVEDGWLVAKVQDELAAGVPAEEIAVIVRSNYEVETITTVLRAAGIPAAPSADSDILTHPITEAALTLLQAVAKPTDEVLLTELLHAPYWGIATADRARVLRAARRDQPLSQLLWDASLLDASGVVATDAVLAISTCLDTVAAGMSVTAPHRLFAQLLETSGLRDHVVAADPHEGARVLHRLYDTIEGMVRRGTATTLTAVLAELIQHRTHGIALPAPYIRLGHAAVAVTTAHKAKGLEFATVLIPHLTDRQWGGSKRAPTFQLPLARHVVDSKVAAEDDARRLFYVAVTRAKERLYLAVSETNADGNEQLPTRFVSGVPETLLPPVDTTAFIADFSLPDALTPAPPYRPEYADFSVSMLESRGLSPTALNHYLRSPWEYWFQSVLRVPQVKSVELEFGTIVHHVLQAWCTESIARGQAPDPTATQSLLTRAFARTAWHTEEVARLHERALTALSAYQTTFIASATPQSQTEVTLMGEIETGLPEFPRLKVTGNLDRVDRTEDGTVLRVVDYKTGKPKTRGQIEGTTKDSDGGYKRQLIFYALLCSLQSDARWHCTTGVLSFVEPGSNGQIREEVFSITEAEIAELKETIISMVRSVVSGDAFTVPCDSEQCRFCHLLE